MRASKGGHGKKSKSCGRDPNQMSYPPLLYVPCGFVVSEYPRGLFDEIEDELLFSNRAESLDLSLNLLDMSAGGKVAAPRGAQYKYYSSKGSGQFGSRQGRWW